MSVVSKLKILRISQIPFSLISSFNMHIARLTHSIFFRDAYQRYRTHSIPVESTANTCMEKPRERRPTSLKWNGVLFKAEYMRPIYNKQRNPCGSVSIRAPVRIIFPTSCSFLRFHFVLSDGGIINISVTFEILLFLDN